MAGEAAVPNWIDDAGAADWNTAILGDAIVPGTVTVHGLKVGIDIDTKKSKGKDKPTSKDTGLRPSKFKLRVWINSKMWPEWQVAKASFQPRRPGRERQPLQIIQPLVNDFGIHEVRVAEIEADSPTAKGGLVIWIHLEEWFDKPVETKAAAKKAVPANPALASAQNAEALDRARRHALAVTRAQSRREMADEDLDPVTGKPVNPGNEDLIREKLFSGQQF